MSINVIRPLKIAVIGSGISGLSAAWLLNKQHQVTLFEKDDRPGGHSNTVNVSTPHGEMAVDTGFIVYNPVNYPNLVEFFHALGVPSQKTDMSFGVSINQGQIEYSGCGLGGLFAQKLNLFRFGHWQMITDLLRFYREAPSLITAPEVQTQTLGEMLASRGYGQAFIHRHLIPMGAAIWSTPADQMLDYPAVTFLRFCQNHGLVQLKDRPQWRTVTGGSREYVNRICSELGDGVRLNSRIHKIHRNKGKVIVEFLHGGSETFDHVVLACHADQALGLLAEPTAEEQRLLSAFPYQRNRALLHTDERLMPRRRAAWASWNYLTDSRGTSGQHPDAISVTYWMNNLQHLPHEHPVFVTLNPLEEPADGKILRSFLYDHPVFSLESIAAQKEIWSLQGRQNTWFCGAYFGYGFHEDGLQAGLAVAEQLGGQQRPWTLDEPSSRIHVQENSRPRVVWLPGAVA
ncbi:NAD(P)/FAD-dependent oxidoreductase [Marinobacterium sediminicola]|uniref:Predicted NAD/FAD-binding protein n=1 Tax=Marinobacterium sediminicola TaxID=518898 RepID=A0ABY1S3D5_9GAMM|nr:FAD-dependent oxidoreductase [Marinobacterium sediminicola]ULG68243.1 FAD-dependent oxidoreductase [Marinobacterium sediminicola]SMR77787.1 Predicted NAD/FAD-binding protein [Marinobacterium sediminicola]